MDKHWLGSVESSGWLNMVRSSLVAAKEVIHLLCIKRHCVLLLGKGWEESTVPSLHVVL